MKTWIAAMATLLACAPFPIRADEAAPIIVNVVWDISLDAEGRVTRLATDDTQVPKAHAQLEEAIRGWQFRSGKIDGRSVATDTHLNIRLAITRVDQHYELEIVRATTGAGYARRVPPRYPQSAVKMRKHGLAMLYVEYDASGRVSKVEPARDVPRPDPRLLKAAMDSVHSWTFSPEAVGGHAIPGIAMVPVCFELPDRRPNCEWKNTETGESMGGDEAVAMNSAATLETDVAGSTL